MTIDRRAMIRAAATLPVVAMGGGAWARAAGFPEAAWRRTPVVNGAGVMPLATAAEGHRLATADVAAIRAAGWAALTDTVAAPGNLIDGHQRVLDGLALRHQIAAANPAVLMMVRSVADIVAAKRDGRLGIIPAIQDTAPIGPALDRIEAYRALGLRVIQLTYNARNLAADGALEPGDAGLSDLGRRTIMGIEDARIVLDLAHAGMRATDEAIVQARRPMLISHTGAHALAPHPRNVTDRQMRACADKGGVVGVYFISFLDRRGRPDRATVIAHLEHMLATCGEDHIAIGTDTTIEGMTVDATMAAENRRVFAQRKAAGIAAPGEGPDIFQFTRGYNDPRRLRTLADDLSVRGWPVARIEKLLGANYLRVCRDCWDG